MLLNVTVLIFWSSQGVYNYGYGIGDLAKYWSQQLHDKENNDPFWPFKSNIEIIDYASNVTYCKSFLSERLAKKPSVSAIMAPEGPVGVLLAPIASKNNIPYILTTSNPSPIRYELPVEQSSSFYIEAPAMYTFRALIEAYIRVGTKTIATVAYSDKDDAGYNYWSCNGAAENLAVPNGISHIASYNLYSNSTNDDVRAIVFELKKMEPDIILWCDWQSCTFNDTISSDRFPLPHFKDADYLSKAFTILDCFGTSETPQFIQNGWMNYITQATFTHPDLKGPEYTEDLLPYGTVFRNPSPMTTVKEQMRFGSGGESPSSVYLFSKWYMETTGSFPPYQSNGYWAALDILEAAIYRVTQNEHMIQNNEISSNDIFTLLLNSQISGMYGRVIFDANHINTPTPTIAIQLYNGEKTPFIVSPDSQSTHPLIYPIPSWRERQYIWSLIKDPTIYSGIGIASFCSFILLTMSITLFVHRKENDIRMLHAIHMISVCGSGILSIWSCVFIWQSDMNEIQCNMKQWFVYLPLSYMVMVMNMKAYRLSIFLHSESKHRLKNLTHNRMLLLSVGWTSITAIVLLFISVFDPPTLVKQIIDPYRPLLDVYTCQWSPKTIPIAYVIVVCHMLFSIGTIISVRNGTGEFRDGMVLKEAFIIFWFCVGITYMIQLLGLNHSVTYIVRTSFISIGVTLFCFRILMTRCYRHCVPRIVEIILMKIIHKFTKFIPDRKQSASISLIDFDDTDGPGYKNEEVDLNEMYNVLADPERAQKFRNFAENALVVENVDFLLAVDKYRKTSTDSIIESSKYANNAMKESALSCYNDFLVVGCNNEINVCSATREKTNQHLQKWEKDEVLMNNETAEYVLDDESKSHVDVFQKAQKEIAIMLYQNIWNKYRTQEIEENMG